VDGHPAVHGCGTEYPAMAGIGLDRPWDDEAPVEVQGFAVVGRG
jgi:hypothetical protein